MADNRQRIAIAALSLSFVGGVTILNREHFVPAAYIPTKGDVPTIGYGSTQGVRMGDTITPERALQRTANELDKVYEPAVKRCAPVPMHQWEYDAAVRLAHNIGPAAFCSSTVAKEFRALRYESACQHILDWHNFRGTDCRDPNQHICRGLWIDRQATYRQCMGEPA